MRSIYIINPRASFTGWGDTDALGNGSGVVMNADLTIVTVAALVPRDWAIRVTDEQVESVDLDTDVRFVALTGKTTQRARIIELAEEFRARGRIVLIGGPLASLDPDLLRPHADILVRGELEELAPKLFGDLESGNWARDYDGGKADIRLSPLPRWDLYPVHAAEMGAIQTTRGCPFDCEFCDVIVYQGRKQRHKSVDQVTRELDLLHATGFRYILIVDDNFTVHLAFARTMLKAMIEWNARHADDPLRFAAQASVDAARNDDLLKLCVEAGLRMLFVGVETNNEASLRETGKRQNLLLPLQDAIATIVGAGIAIRAGIVLGFDHDRPETIESLFDFVQAVPLPDLTINALTASKGTRLYERLNREGRLVEGMWNTSFETNILPIGMSRLELMEAVRAFTANAYAVSAFEKRMLNFIALFPSDEEAPVARTSNSKINHGRFILRVLKKLSARGPEEARMVSNVLATAGAKPSALQSVMAYLTNYEKARFYLDRERSAVRPSPV